jgi:hypothetical protein
MNYLFVGQLNTKIGRTNEKTGRMSILGDLMVFNTLKQRNQFYKNAYSHNTNFSIIKTTQKSAKSRFYAGLTQCQYLDYICYVDSDMIDYSRYDLNMKKGEQL